MDIQVGVPEQDDDLHRGRAGQAKWVSGGWSGKPAVVLATVGPAPVPGAAIAVSLPVLAASVPFGFQEARGYYGSTLDGIKQLPTLAPGMKTIVVGWVALALGLIAGWLFRLSWPPATAAVTVRAATKAESPDFSANREWGAVYESPAFPVLRRGRSCFGSLPWDT
ncbi:hypothetical protein [Thioalkalivibrio sp.]|uniref:hypothetical protein n=1 Tax=Thioalkalivibrio sp. TaxID=2093813 RepID=UPI003975B20D